LTVRDIVVLRFGKRRIPRALRGLHVVDVAEPGSVEPPTQPRRVVVLGTHADLATVLTGLLRTDRLDVEVGFVYRSWSAGRARSGTARRVPLIRDDTGTVITRAAHWLPPDGSARTIVGEAVVDDTVLFDGAAAGVRIEPIEQLPGLRARALTAPMRPRRWMTGRAVQLGTTGAQVVRDGVAGPRPVRRSTFYRHTEGWLAVR
jgi:hypothetical protein